MNHDVQRRLEDRRRTSRETSPVVCGGLGILVCCCWHLCVLSLELLAANGTQKQGRRGCVGLSVRFSYTQLQCPACWSFPSYSGVEEASILALLWPGAQSLSPCLRGLQGGGQALSATAQ